MQMTKYPKGLKKGQFLPQNSNKHRIKKINKISKNQIKIHEPTCIGMAPGGICPPKFIPIMPCMLGCMTGTIGNPCCCCCCCCCMGTIPAETHTNTVMMYCRNGKKNSVFNYYLKHDSKPNLKYTEEKLIQV